jgi:outer membrane lipoprotein-sorting protein
MNKLFRYSYLAIAVGILASSFSVTETRAQNVLREVLKRMDTHNKSLQSLQAGVTMVKYDSVLKVYDTSIGSTSYLPKSGKRVSYVRVDWTKPVEEQMAVIGDDYEVYRPRLNQVIVGKVQKAQGRQGVGNALSFINMNKAQLEANYDPVFIGIEDLSGGVRTWHIQLTPLKPTSYKLADLWVDADGMPRQARVTAQNNDTTTVLLSSIQKNVSIKGDLFKLAYDKKKVKVIKA